ncbi:MAG: serine/threonine-protein kinase [Lysobacterales bacterium]
MTETVNIPGYRVVEPLGVGGMASVYLAVQESLDREVALKVMAPALAANQEFADRFLKEGRITAKLSHPNLVTVFDIGRHENLYYLAAEYIPGGTLRERMNRGMQISEVLELVRDIAAGLNFAHDKGFVHRDVKPGNILFRNDSSAVLADFGIAKSMDSKTMATQIGSSIGTPHYMSPEQARAEKVDGRSDLYALGAVMFECLANRAPYEAADPFTIALMHVTHPVPQLPEPLRWLQPIIESSMAKDANQRYANGEAFIVALDKLVSNAPQAREVRDRRPGSARSSRQNPVQAQTPVPPKRPVPTSKPEYDDEFERSRLPTRKTLLIAGTSLAFAVAAAFVFLREDASPPAAADTGTSVATTEDPVADSAETVGNDATASDPAASSSGFITPLPAGSDAATLIKRAQEYVEIGVVQNGRRLNEPEGDCATDLFKLVLAADPDNEDAKAGLSRIADFYESKAKATFDRGLYTGSEILAEEGLKAQPDNAGLKQLLEDSRRAGGH